MHSHHPQNRKSPVPLVVLSIVSGLAFLFFMAERAPLTKPEAWSEKRWAIHGTNTLSAELGMIICGLLTLLFLVIAAVRYFRHRTYTQHDTNAA
jgi:hypothetical protein